MTRNLLVRALMVTTALLVALLLWRHGPIAQDPGYHAFADRRAVAGIPNFWNVVSNAPFFLVGLFGLSRLPRRAAPATGPGYAALCLGVTAVGLGSGYYHLSPSNESLVWDRLPMTVAFVALLSLLLDERVFVRSRPALLAAMLVGGVASVAYWAVTEARGAGDLRPYILVQFLPMLLVPLLLALPARYLSTGWIAAALGGYVLAKLLEHFDALVLGVLGVSGHSLKHVAAAAAVACILRAVPVLERDQPASASQSRGRR